MDEDIYVVEKILNKRILDNGEIEYFLKWFGYNETDSTWEPEENVFCKDLIEIYEKTVNIETDCRLLLSQIVSQIEILDNESECKSSSSLMICEKRIRSDSSQDTIETSHYPIDYLSLEPERIVSITRSRLPSQQLEFLLKCTHCPKKLFFISNEKAKELVPDLLIDFYERHINWFINKSSNSNHRHRYK